MEIARIAELLEPFLHSQDLTGNSAELTESQLFSLSTYLDLLLRWNARINLTAIREPEQIITRHFGESLFAARHLFPSEGELEKRPVNSEVEKIAREHSHFVASPWGGAPHVLDVGSGAGFPGIPLKLWAPDVKLTLIESTRKKATFLREVIRTLEINNTAVFGDRAEFFGEPAEVVTFRAVEQFEKSLPVALRLVKPRGRLALLIGESQVGVAFGLAPYVRWNEPIPIPVSSNRVLVIGRNPENQESE